MAASVTSRPFASSSRTSMGATYTSQSVAPVANDIATSVRTADRSANAVRAAGTAQSAGSDLVNSSGETIAVGGKPVDVALGVTNAAVMAASLPIGLGQLGIGFGGGAMRKVGEWTGWEWLEKKGVGAGKFLEKAESYTVNDVIAKTGSVGKAAFSATEHVATGVATVADVATKPVSRRFQVKNAEKAEFHFSRSKNQFATFTSELAGASSGMHADIREHFDKMQSVLQEGHANGHFTQQHRTDFHKAHEALENAITEHKYTPPKSLTNALKDSTASLEKAYQHHSNAMGWKDVKGTIKGKPGSWRNASALHTVMNGAFIAGSGLQIVQGIRDFATGIRSVEAMESDLSGKKVSALDVLTGNISSAGRSARNNTIKHLVIDEAAGTVGMAVNIKSARAPHWNGMSNMAAFMLPDMVAQGLNAMVGQSPTETYNMLASAHNRGQQIPPEAYAALVGAACPELIERGGANSAFAHEIGKQLAAENKSPKQVMDEIQNGGIMARVHKITEAAAASKAAHSAASHHSSPSTSHTQRLASKNGSQATSRPVVGEGVHTGKLQTEAPANALTGPA